MTDIQTLTITAESLTLTGPLDAVRLMNNFYRLIVPPEMGMLILTPVYW